MLKVAVGTMVHRRQPLLVNNMSTLHNRLQYFRELIPL